MIITFDGVSVTYNKNMGYEQKALDCVNLAVASGDFIGIAGRVGSGKSTFLQLLNGILKPSSGSVSVDGMSTTVKSNYKLIRRKIGLVFQYPEHQLFGATVYEDIAFGLKNLEIYENEEVMVKEAMALVGLDFECYYDQNPFSLSGGEQRRVAIAGVLARKPDVLALDEPSAGLDAVGRTQLCQLLKSLHQKGKTILMVSHDMDLIFEMSNRLLVFYQGKVFYDGLLDQAYDLKINFSEAGIAIPTLLDLSTKLRERNSGILGFNNVEEGIKQILSLYGGK